MPQQYVLVKLMGRCGNQFYQIAAGLAYAKKYDMDFFVTNTAENAYNNTKYFNFPIRDNAWAVYGEKINEKGEPYYAEMPPLSNPYLIGFWQSFKYFDEHRNYILSSFNIPYNKLPYVSIHVRRGDYLVHSDKFPPLPLEYYKKAVEFMNLLGYYKFMVFSDDINYCKSIFIDENFNSLNVFEYSESKSELEDLSLMSSCLHNIVANSSFSFVGAWLNQNPEKIVVCPPQEKLFVGANQDMIPDYFTIIKYQ